MPISQKYVHLLIPTSYIQASMYAIVTGILLGCSFPPYHAGFLAFISLIPLLYSLDYFQYKSKKQQVFVLYLCFFIYHGITNWWVGSWQAESDPFLIVAGVALWIGHPFFLMIPYLAYIYIKKRLSFSISIIALPFLVISYEWLHSLTDFSYPWLTVGYTLIYHEYIVQCADLAGVWGLSFLVVGVNSACFYILKTNNRKKNTAIISTIALVLCASYIYGNITYNRIQNLSKQAPKIKIAVVQSNINPWQKWSGGVFSQVEKHFTLMGKMSDIHPDLYVWSETAIPFLNIETNTKHDFSYFLTRNNAVPILSGFADFVLLPNSVKEPLAKPYPLIPGYKYIAHNAAILIQYKGGNPIHRKMKLTPFGEGFPFSQDFELLAGFLEWGVGISGWKKGAVQQTLPFYDQHKKLISSIGTVICIESIYPDFVRNYAKQGASMLVVITNDAWFDNSPGPMQHFAISQMRAIESHRAIARCGNTGISGFIGADGSITAIAPAQQEEVLMGSVPQLYDLTLYSLYGDYLPFFASLFSLILLVIAGYFQKKSLSSIKNSEVKL